jgi:hypothetical protein
VLAARTLFFFFFFFTLFSLAWWFCHTFCLTPVQIYVELQVSRRYEYYLTRMLSVLALVVMMTWCTTVVPFEAVHDRFNINVTLFLAAVHSSPLDSYSCSS